MVLSLRYFLLKLSLFYLLLFFFFFFFKLEWGKLLVLIGSFAVFLLFGPKKEEQTDVPILSLIIIFGVFCLISSSN